MGDFRSTNRQPLITSVTSHFTFADVDGANPICDIPVGAIVTGGQVIVLTAFGAGRTLDVGDREDPSDGTAGDDDRYTPSAFDVSAAGVFDLTPDGIAYTKANTMTFTVVGTAPVAGEGLIIVQYVLPDRGLEVHPLRTLPAIES